MGIRTELGEVSNTHFTQLSNDLKDSMSLQEIAQLNSLDPFQAENIVNIDLNMNGVLDTIIGFANQDHLLILLDSLRIIVVVGPSKSSFGNSITFVEEVTVNLVVGVPQNSLMYILFGGSHWNSFINGTEISCEEQILSRNYVVKMFVPTPDWGLYVFNI